MKGNLLFDKKEMGFTNQSHLRNEENHVRKVQLTRMANVHTVINSDIIK